MTYDAQSELDRVRKYYEGDPLQKRLSALIYGEIGSGKTYLLRTARFPIHIDSFDPGGTKCLKPWIDKGDIVCDTTWENEDPYNPKVFADWMRTTEVRLQIGYFDQFGTYTLDGLSMFSEAVMNYELKKAGREGEAPMHRRDYNPQKVEIVNRIKRFMSLKPDFFLMAHLRREEDVIGQTKEGLPIKEFKYRLNVTGNAVLSLPLLFDEIYILEGKETSSGLERSLIIEAQGKYIARSRLKSDGKLGMREDADIKKLLKKIGLNWEDKSKLTL